MKYLLTINGKLNNLNDYIAACRTNAYAGAKMKSYNENLVKYSIYEQLRGVRIESPVLMEYHWYEPNKRRDLDNISSFGRKVIQDALVDTGVLANDSWNEIKGFSDQFDVDKANPRIEVEIKEIER